MRLPNGQEYYYLPRELYSVAALTDESGTIVEAATYDTYGKVTVYDDSAQEVDASPVGNPYYFTGRRLDLLPLADGLKQAYHYRARGYDPGNGRFLQRDPMENLAGMNLRTYASCSPTVRTDSTGTYDEAFMYITACKDQCNCCGCGESTTAMETEGVGYTVGVGCKEAADQAVKASNEEFSGIGGEDNQKDAFRHCYGQCIAALRPEVGPSGARKCGDIHELCGMRNGNSAGGEAMDQHNNSLGRSFAAKAGATQNSCRTDCKNAVIAAGQHNCPGEGSTKPVAANEAQTCPGGPRPPNSTFPGCYDGGNSGGGNGGGGGSTR